MDFLSYLYNFPLDLNFTILGLEYRVSGYFWDFIVEGLKATEAKAFLLKRSSSLEDFRWDTFGGIKRWKGEGMETGMITAHLK